MRADMIRPALCAVVLLTLAGCDKPLSPPVAQCEKYLVSKLRSPSTYKRVSYSEILVDPAKIAEPGDGIDPNGEPYYAVSIDYDANNAFNAPIRGQQLCQFDLVDGKPDTSGYIDFDQELLDRAGI